MLPEIQHTKISARICNYCRHVNGTNYNFCTNCSYPLHDKLLVASFYKALDEKKESLFKAANSVFIARSMLYVMAVCLLPCLLVLFSSMYFKYIIAIVALILSALFFSLALWSRREPFAAMFTAFIMLVTFSAINISIKLDIVFTTSHGLISLLLCVSLLFIMMKGLQGAYILRLFTGTNAS